DPQPLQGVRRDRPRGLLELQLPHPRRPVSALGPGVRLEEQLLSPAEGRHRGGTQASGYVRLRRVGDRVAAAEQVVLPREPDPHQELARACNGQGEGPAPAGTHRRPADPRRIIWIVLGLIGLVWRRPRGTQTLLALGLAAMLVIVFNALGLFADPHFALPVAPAFVLLAAGALLGRRPAGP